MERIDVMIPIVKPHGAISVRLARGIAIERTERFLLLDIYGNRYGIEETIFNQLKEKGYKIYEIKQSFNH